MKTMKRYFSNPFGVRVTSDRVLEDYLLDSASEPVTELLCEFVEKDKKELNYRVIGAIADEDVEDYMDDYFNGRENNYAYFAFVLCRKRYYYQTRPWYATCPVTVEYAREVVKDERVRINHKAKKAYE